MADHIGALALGVLTLVACNLPNEPNLNNPSDERLLGHQRLAASPGARSPAACVCAATASPSRTKTKSFTGRRLGRDGMRLTGSEPRFVTELLGPSSIDPSDFLGGALWPYATCGSPTSACTGSPARPRPARRPGQARDRGVRPDDQGPDHTPGPRNARHHRRSD